MSSSKKRDASSLSSTDSDPCAPSCCCALHGTSSFLPSGSSPPAALVRNDTFDRPIIIKALANVGSPEPQAKRQAEAQQPQQPQPPPQQQQKEEEEAQAAPPPPPPSSSSAAASAPVDGPRQGVLSWDDYFMSVAFLSAMRSKDPSTQVGACIVNVDNRIIGIGYNGFPRGCCDDSLPWSRVGPTELDTKYPYVCHAEVNAILNKCSADVRSSRIYVALYPCNECAKIIIQSDIREVVYLSDKYHDTNTCRASRKMFDMSGVKTRQHIPKGPLLISFEPGVSSASASASAPTSSRASWGNIGIYCSSLALRIGS